jgi:hypothetical protein
VWGERKGWNGKGAAIMRRCLAGLLHQAVDVSRLKLNKLL